MKMYFKALLLDDVILTENSATAGFPSSVDFLPGAALLGAVAAQLYADLGDAAWTVFHSGKVTFHPAYPLLHGGNGSPIATVPIPLSAHHEKTVEEKIVWAHRDDLERGKPWVQVRSGFFHDSGKKVQPEHHSTLRTAMGSDGRARESFLFGTDAIAAGTEYLVRISADDDVPRELLGRLVKAVVGVRRFGRSRRTEFGRVRISEIDGDAGLSKLRQPTSTNAKQIALYFATDTALRDVDTGAPTLWPSPAALGIDVPGARIDASRTFVRARAYSPFNSHRRRPSLERQVIQAGSVVTLTGVEQGQVVQALSGGVGDYRNEGLGEVWVDPKLFDQLPSRLVLAKESAHDQTKEPPGRDSLTAWLKAKSKLRTDEQRAWNLATRWADSLERAGRRDMRSQWGEVRRLAVATKPEELLAALFADPKQSPSGGFTRRGKSKLSKQWGDKIEGKTLWERFETLVTSSDLDQAGVARAVELLGARMAKKANQQDDTEETK